MIARGLMLGPDQPVILHLLDIEPALESLNGVKMELIDAAFPLLRGVVATKDSVEACTGVDIAIMVGGFPRKEGMERKDVMSKNVSIYKDQASALEKHASPNCKVLMVANPANTNALILKEFAPSFPEKNITCLTRLDHNRALGQISEKTDVQVRDVKNGIIWGNHSSTQYPDVSHATVTTSSGEVPVKELVKNEQWIKPEFIKTVQQRGAATIQARKLSSALSAASSACDHIRDWVLGTPKDDQLLHYIVKHNLLKPIVDAFVDNGDRYNLLNSAVLELFEYIRKENLKTLIMYLIDSFWNQLVKFDYLTSIQALKLKYEQCQESLETKRNVSVVDPRKRIDERALEKEEEDYFNEDSDEEDSASAQSSHTQKQATQTVVPNGVSISYPAVRSKSGGLVDYDDDEDDEDYNPPPRRKPEISGDGRTMEFSQKAKRKHRSEEEFELRKKQRLHRVLNNDNVSLAAACSTCTNTVSHSEITNTMSNSIPHSPDEVNESSNDGKNSEKKPSLSRSCSDCSAKTADSRQPNEDDCPVVSSSVNNSSLEVAVNGANVPGSEPYSVR